MSKNYDPPMHTAEHVLNQTMVRMFACERSYSSHLNSGKSKCDYSFPRPLEEEEAVELEKRVNEVLAQHLPVRQYLLPRAEAEKRVRLNKLPAHLENMTDLDIRLVEVGDYDVCPCIGEHVSNTSEVGTFRLISHDFSPAQDKAKPNEPEQNEVTGANAGRASFGSGAPDGAGGAAQSRGSGRLRVRFKLA